MGLERVCLQRAQPKEGFDKSSSAYEDCGAYKSCGAYEGYSAYKGFGEYNDRPSWLSDWRTITNCSSGQAGLSVEFKNNSNCKGQPTSLYTKGLIDD